MAKCKYKLYTNLGPDNLTCLHDTKNNVLYTTDLKWSSLKFEHKMIPVILVFLLIMFILNNFTNFSSYIALLVGSALGFRLSNMVFNDNLKFIKSNEWNVTTMPEHLAVRHKSNICIDVILFVLLVVTTGLTFYFTELHIIAQICLSIAWCINYLLLYGYNQPYTLANLKVGDSNE